MISELKDEIREIKTKSMSGDDRSVASVSAQNLEEIIAEVEERSRRSCNIIVFGSSEQGSTKSEQATLDAALMEEMLGEMELPLSDHKPLRLGRFDGTKQRRSRPIRIRLATSDAVRRAVRVFRDLKRNGRFSALSIAFDRTPRQVAFYRSVKLELSNRIDAGEVNLEIKYKNGVPAIVRSEN